MDEPEKTKCTSCRCKKLPSQLVAGKTWCIVRAESWKRYRAKNPERIKEVSKKYDAAHREEKKAYNQNEKDCEVCGCKVKNPNWSRHLKCKKHFDNLNRGL